MGRFVANPIRRDGNSGQRATTKSSFWSACSSGAYLQGSDLTLTELDWLTWGGWRNEQRCLRRLPCQCPWADLPVALRPRLPVHDAAWERPCLVELRTARALRRPACTAALAAPIPAQKGLKTHADPCPGPWLHRATSVCAVGLLCALLTLEISMLSSALSSSKISTYHILMSDRR